MATGWTNEAAIRRWGEMPREILGWLGDVAFPYPTPPSTDG